MGDDKDILSLAMTCRANWSFLTRRFFRDFQVTYGIILCDSATGLHNRKCDDFEIHDKHGQSRLKTIDLAGRRVEY